jgi:plasmid replication initiation protein
MDKTKEDEKSQTKNKKEENPKQQYLPIEVKKSNSLARAVWHNKSDSVWERRIFTSAVSRIKDTDEDFKDYKMPLADLFYNQINLGGAAYSEIKRIMRTLAKTIISVETDKEYTVYPIFSMCRFDRKKLTISVSFNNELKDFLLQLKKEFIHYNLFEYLGLPSTYSQQIFELLKSWAGLPYRRIELEELHKILNVPESFKYDFHNFKERVLIPAETHIKKHTSFEYEWYPIKQGKRIVAVNFIFDKNKLEEIEAEKEKKKKEKVEQLELIEKQKLLEETNQINKELKECWENRNRNKGKCNPEINNKCKKCQEIFPRHRT